jgi:DNA-binding response OmpR family regulator
VTHETPTGGISVLLVDDDKKLCRLVREYLGPLGYDVTSAHTGPEGLDMALSGSFQVVILDVMLPGMDGFDVLRRLRQESDVPVLMLTSRGDETDRIVGLEIGADDYLPKTFSTRELLARLRAVTRRALEWVAEDPPGFAKPIVVGRLRIDPGPRVATLDDRVLDLTRMEFDLLRSLARSAGRVLSRDQLLRFVAGRDYDASTARSTSTYRRCVANWGTIQRARGTSKRSEVSATCSSRRTLLTDRLRRFARSGTANEPSGPSASAVPV